MGEFWKFVLSSLLLACASDKRKLVSSSVISNFEYCPVAPQNIHRKAGTSKLHGSKSGGNVAAYSSESMVVYHEPCIGHSKIKMKGP